MDLTAGQEVEFGTNTTAQNLFYAPAMTIQQLPVSSVVMYNPNELEAKALVNDFVELSSNTNFTAAYSDVLTLSIPSAGTYRIHAKVCSSFDVNAAPNYARLSIDGSAVLGTEISL